MSSILIFTAESGATWHFKSPIKALFSRRYFDTDGSCGDGIISLDSISDMAWLEGVRDSINRESLYKTDLHDLSEIIDLMNGGSIIRAWHEY